MEHQVVAAGTLEHVRHRQHRERGVGAAQLEHLRTRLDVGEDAGVTELHALGLAGGARGVDDGRQRIGLERLDLERRRGCWQEGGEGVGRWGGPGRRRRGSLDADHRRQGRHQFAQAGQGTRRVQHQQPGVGITDAPGDVLGVVDHVQRHHDQSHAERGLVDRDPLHAVLQADRDAVALLEAAHPECLLPASGEGDHLRDRIIVPRRSFGAAIGSRAGFPLPVQHLVRRARMTLQQLCEVVHPGVPGGARMQSLARLLESGTSGGCR